MVRCPVAKLIYGDVLDLIGSDRTRDPSQVSPCGMRFSNLGIFLIFGIVIFKMIRYFSPRAL